MKILVVDDEQAVCDSLRRSLSFNGYNVVLAEDGIQALEMIDKEQPALVILDVMMPRMDGLEVCRHLRSEGDDRPILILTARDNVSDRVGGLDAGADDYLAKPFALEELLARVRSLVRRSAVESNQSSNIEQALLSTATDAPSALLEQSSRSCNCSSKTKGKCSLAPRFWKRSGAAISPLQAMPSRSTLDTFDARLNWKEKTA